eukprot:2535344-Rhodomonas_salina.1
MAVHTRDEDSLGRAWRRIRTFTTTPAQARAKSNSSEARCSRRLWRIAAKKESLCGESWGVRNGSTEVSTASSYCPKEILQTQREIRVHAKPSAHGCTLVGIHCVSSGRVRPHVLSLLTVLCSGAASTISPLASTTSAARMLSASKPCFRAWLRHSLYQSWTCDSQCAGGWRR